MNKLYLYLFEPFNNLSKRLYITIITILFLSAFFLFIGVFSNVFDTENLSLSLKNNETYLTYHQMNIHTPMEEMISGKSPVALIHEMNYLAESDPEEWSRIQIETDRLICDLYNMQNDDFFIEFCISRSFQLPGLPKLFDQSFIQADESFFEHEYLPICKGRGITQEDFDEIRNAKSRKLIINVIAGYSYMEYYNVGDIIGQEYDPYIDEYLNEEIENYTLGPYDQEYASYRIVGFIEKDVTFANASGYIRKTDNQIFIPHVAPISINFPVIAEKGNYPLADRITQWKILIRKGKTDEYADIINQKLNGLFIDKYYDLIDSANNTRAILDQVVAARNDSFIIIAIILLIFSVSGIIVSTVNKFKTNIRSYTVHMTVGATNKDIYAFSAIEMLMQIIIALAIAHIPFILRFLDIPILRFINRNIPYMHSSSMYIMIMIFTVLFIAVTVAVTAWCIKKYSIAEILKGKE